MTVSAITSANAGTAVVSGAGAITGLTVTLPLPSNADGATQLALLDAAAAPSGFARTLFAAALPSLAYLFEPRSVNPIGGTATPPGNTLIKNANITFSNGIYVKSCPANMTFSLTTTP